MAAKTERCKQGHGYIRVNGISETGDTKQAQALQLFIAGTTNEEFKHAIPGYSKTFNGMLNFFIANGYVESEAQGRTYLKKGDQAP